ncbi:holo-ACP synthase [Aerococcus agrisoli]|uniref:Holo-[acyl-carrier-protein] synthase n=1 Tax=Aerococcus agrisoli TaxID=2487350 RepID=A0A3N4GG88_9LACT|nr:holo-ACP synthase [Aerococcus agrisoli]RPA60417.1 holo-ACP synthase [Aerococcus agrisoli]
MIIGLGSDIVEIDRIQKAVANNPRFARKVLTDAELSIFEAFSNDTRRYEYLAGRWAAKEAFSKAYGTGISSQLHFHDIEVANDEQQKPYIKTSKVDDYVHITISHTAHYATATVIIESI